MNDPIVIVGGGHAAAALASALVREQLAVGAVLLTDEPHPPYQRPPLSKGFLKTADQALQPHRVEDWYREAGIVLRTGQRVERIDRERRVIVLASGEEQPYGRLVLATGARPRLLPGLSPELSNVAVLRDAADAARLREAMSRARALTVVGGGFIGLEAAATARELGLEVTVLESAPRLLMRAVSAEIAEHVRAVHEAAGIRIRTEVRTGAPRIEGDRVASIDVDGVAEPVDLLLLGIGAVPRTELAEAAGLACDDGIVVDPAMRTSDPLVLAIGDCTRYPCTRHGCAMRLESVQNANDQAAAAAATLAGRPADTYSALPWFWSDQGTLRLQMTGLMPARGERYRRPGAAAGSFSVLHYVDGRFVCIESVNIPADHIVGRKLLEAGKSPDPAKISDPAVTMKSLMAG